MNKFYLLLGAAALSVTATAASNGSRIDLSKKVKTSAIKEQATANKPEIQSTSDVTVIPLRASKVASVDRKSVVLYEDFDNVPDGATETIDKIGERYTDYIASHYENPGRYVDNEYTPETGTWEGDWVMAGKNGTVILQPYNPQMHAQLNTPLGDYSGDLTVTVRCRYAKSFWGSYQSATGYVTSGASELSLGLFKGGYDQADYAVTDAGTYSSISSGQFFEPDGWQEITFKVRNENSDADGFLSFFSSYAVEIDWIKVTDDNTFLAAPVMRGATDFTNDGFTIHWDQVRRSYNYYIDLWKTVYTAPEGVNVSADFEDLALPEWLTGNNAELQEGMGVDGTAGIVLVDNGVNGGVSTIDFGKKLDSFSFQFMMNLDMYSPDVDWDNLPTLWIDVYGDNGWEPYGQLVIDGMFIYPGYFSELVLDGPDFEGMYTAVRLYASNTDEETLVHIDDIAVYAQRPYELERVKGPKGAIYDPENDDFDYNYYYFTDDADRRATSFTFTGLEPETEYWYRVRSHYIRDFGGTEKLHALGVAAPELLPATNITKTSYTANWTDAPKAQKYLVKNYKGTIITSDEENHTLMADNFSNCTGKPDYATIQPIGNNAECGLDEYTDLPGWRGKNNAMGKNILGTETYKGGYLITPPMMVNPNRGDALVYVEFMGMYGDYLQITSLKNGNLGTIPFNEDGEIVGWMKIPAVEGDQLKFSSYYNVAIALSGFEVAQDVKAGDVVRVLQSTAEVPAGEQAYTFNNLEGGIYAYSVVSLFNLERDNAESTSNQYITVDTETGVSNSTNKIEFIGSGEEEVTRYSVDGTKVDKDFKGIVLIEMKDGSIVKKVSK